MKRRAQKTEAVPVPKDEILPEYDFSNSRPNKYATRYVTGSNMVVLEPGVPERESTRLFVPWQELTTNTSPASPVRAAAFDAFES